MSFDKQMLARSPIRHSITLENSDEMSKTANTETNTDSNSPSSVSRLFILLINYKIILNYRFLL